MCKSRLTLVLDDDALQLQILQLLLDSQGIHAAYFQEPVVALERAVRSAAPVTLLMDVNLPDHAGHDAAGFAAQLRAACAGVHVVGISATAPPQSVLNQFDYFLLKPADAGQLAAALCPFTAKPHPAPLNDAVLQGLAQHMRADQLASLFDVYFADATARLQSVEAAIQQDDAAAFRNAAHALKGSSAMLGLQSVAATTGQMEALCQGASFGDCLPHAASLLVSAIDRLEQGRVLLAPRLRVPAATAPLAPLNQLNQLSQLNQMNELNKQNQQAGYLAAPVTSYSAKAKD